MTLNWKAQVVLVLVVIGACVAFGWHLRSDGKTDAALRSELAQVDSVRRWAVRRADSLDAAYRVDTVRLTRLKVQTDTLTQTVERWKRDTLRVVEYVVKADSTIKACTQALATCEERVGAQRVRAEAAEKASELLKAHLPSKWAPTVHRAQGALLGVLVGVLIGR